MKRNYTRIISNSAEDVTGAREKAVPYVILWLFENTIKKVFVKLALSGKFWREK